MLPAGLITGLEIFRSGSDVKVAHNGKICDYLELHSTVREPFQVELIADKNAIKVLNDYFKLFSGDEMEEKFVGCRYGTLDSVPDVAGCITHPDAPNCENILTCPGFNVICKIPAGVNGTLSACEYKVMVLVSQGKLDKEIADIMQIELSTVRTYQERIRTKLGVNNKIEIALWAHNKGVSK